MKTRHAPTPAIQNVRDLAADRPWGSTDEFLLAVKEAHSPNGAFDARLRSETVNSRNGSDGGFLMPAPLFENRIGDAVDDLYILQNVDRRTVLQGFEYIGVTEDESSLADGERHGGMKMTLVPEDTAYPYTFPKLRQVRLTLRSWGTIVPVTGRLLEAAPTMETSLSKVAFKSVAFTEADKIWNGTGAGEPLGVRNASALITEDIEVGQSIANTVTHIRKNGKRMVKRGHRLGRSAFYVHQDILADAIEADVLSAPDAGAPFGRLATRPIFPNEVSPPVGTVGDFVLADMSDYLLAQKTLRRDVSIHVRFEFDESLFRFTKYLDGQPSTSGPITPFSGALTKSPIVALAARS